jgi:hypothetical protein
MYYKDYFSEMPAAKWRIVPFNSSEYYATSGLGHLLADGTLVMGGFPPSLGISKEAKPELISRVLTLLEANPDAAEQYVCKIYALCVNSQRELVVADLPLIDIFLIQDFIPGNHDAEGCFRTAKLRRYDRQLSCCRFHTLHVVSTKPAAAQIALSPATLPNAAYWNCQTYGWCPAAPVPTVGVDGCSAAKKLVHTQLMNAFQSTKLTGLLSVCRQPPMCTISYRALERTLHLQSVLPSQE